MGCLCHCGCGLPTSIARQSDTKRGWVKGQPVRFRVGHNHRGRKRVKGHVTVYRPDHPKATSSGCVYLHVLLAEQALGRVMPAGVEVHHVDGDVQHNENRNLVICQDKAYHKLLHVRTRVVKAGGNPNTQRVCSTCQQLRGLDAFHRAAANVSAGLQTQCKDCTRKGTAA